MITTCRKKWGSQSAAWTKTMAQSKGDIREANFEAADVIYVCYPYYTENLFLILGNEKSNFHIYCQYIMLLISFSLCS
jgi:hypothetical protein